LVSFWACGFGKKHVIKISVMEFLASHFIEIGYVLLVVAGGMLIGAVKIALDLFLEYRATQRALKEQAERYNILV
jgi:hypothetical protein